MCSLYSSALQDHGVNVSFLLLNPSGPWDMSFLLLILSGPWDILITSKSPFTLSINAIYHESIGGGWWYIKGAYMYFEVKIGKNLEIICVDGQGYIITCDIISSTSTCPVFSEWYFITVTVL